MEAPSANRMVCGLHSIFKLSSEELRSFTCLSNDPSNFIVQPWRFVAPAASGSSSLIVKGVISTSNKSLKTIVPLNRRMSFPDLFSYTRVNVMES